MTVRVDDGKRKRQTAAPAKSVTIHGRRRAREAACACGSEGGGDTRLDGQRARHVGRAREHGAGHHRLRGALRRQGAAAKTQVVGPQATRTGATIITGVDVRARATRCRCARDSARGHERLVALRHRGRRTRTWPTGTPGSPAGSRTFSVPENTAAGWHRRRQPLIAATDQDGDLLVYTLEGVDADSFDILSTGSGGQIGTSAELNHEEKQSYSVTVRVTGRQGRDRRGQRDDQGDGRRRRGARTRHWRRR